MSNVNLTMTDWNISQTTPPINLGYSGENNAITISIVIDEDEVFEFSDTTYYLDIIDKVDDNMTADVQTQEMELITETETSDVLDDDGNQTYDDNGDVITETTTTYTLQLQPTTDWLGKNHIKYLQVRCEYTDDTDTSNPISVIIKSNTFKGIVGLGLS